MKAKEVKEISERVFNLLATYRLNGMDALIKGVRELEYDLPIGYMKGWVGSYINATKSLYNRDGEAYHELCGFYAGLQAAIWAMEGDEYKNLEND